MDLSKKLRKSGTLKQTPSSNSHGWSNSNRHSSFSKPEKIYNPQFYLSSNPKTIEKKQKFFSQIKELHQIIKENFNLEAEILFILSNSPSSIRQTKEEFNNISYKLFKSTNTPINLSFGLILIDSKGEDFNIVQPLKVNNFAKNSYDHFKSFIEAKFMNLSEKSQIEEKKLPYEIFLKILESIQNTKWTLKKAKFCILSTEIDEKLEIQTLNEHIKKLEEINNIKLFYTKNKDLSLTFIKQEEESKSNSTKRPLIIITPISISEEIQQTCINIDLKFLKEKTNILPNFQFHLKNISSTTSLELNRFLSTVPLELKLDPTRPNFSNNDDKEILEVKAYSFFIVKDRDIDIDWTNPYIQTSSMKTKIWVSPNPFAEGMMRYAFYMKDVELEENLVGKIPKILDDNYNVESMKNDCESLVIFEHLISEFNERIVWRCQSTEQPLLNVVHSYIYEIITPNYPYKYIWVENLLEGDYKKYNNNAGWYDPTKSNYNELAQAFSHFSWQFTNGYLIIVDLQGPYGAFTDPQIHCHDHRKFGGGNFGEFGMIKFFMTHKCNHYCEDLELVHLNQTEKINFKDSFWTQQNETFDKLVGKHKYLVKLCDLCRMPYKMSIEEYWENKKENIRECEDYCCLCSRKHSESIRYGGNCEDCNNKFWYSSYWFLKKRTENPVRCPNCRRLKRKRDRKLFYQKFINQNK